jgi:hypothetical protein
VSESFPLTNIILIIVIELPPTSSCLTPSNLEPPLATTMTLLPTSVIRVAALILLVGVVINVTGLSHPSRVLSRRSVLLGAPTVAAAVILSTAPSANAAAAGADLQFQTSSNGLQWADAKVGTGTPLKNGSTATIDYVMSTTGARYGSRIFGTAEKDMPYRWTLGDGSTIAGIEQAILGTTTGIPPMLPGGIRRVVIPQALGFLKLAQAGGKDLCVQDGRPGPIPPPKLAFEEYQRFKNIYCNPNRQYQPDLVMDIKLYGARSLR